MVSASSVIKVSIIGDVRNLQKALGQANTSSGGLIASGAKVLGGAILISKGVDAVFGTIQTGLDNADKFGDAMGRLAKLTTPEFATNLSNIAFNMSDIGLSAPEVAQMAADFAAFATSAKVSEPAIENITPKILDVAAAISQQTGKPLDEVISDIGRAANGQQKSVADYGIVVDKALNPDDRLTSILTQLQGRFGNAKTAADDLAGGQDKLSAKWDNFTTKLGQALEGPLTGVIGFLNDELTAIPGAIVGLQELGGAFETLGRTALAPLGNINDALGGIGDVITNVLGAFGRAFGGPLGGNSEGEAADTIRRFRERNGLP